MNEKPTNKTPWHSIIKTFLKVVGFLGLMIITAHETYACVKRFMDGPKYTSNQLTDQSNAEFPSLTFCNQIFMGYKSKVLKVS